ncbi:MAG: histidine kinase [Gemmatimonadota bacterium]|nr:histidine kinase [Gemmatimonadota bacterium]
MSPALRLPLLGKLAGANLLIVTAMAAITFRLHGAGALDRQAVAIATLTLLASFIASTLLVSLALAPIAQLEALASRVLDGDLDGRITPSPIADRRLLHVGETVNLLLAGVAAERVRFRQLAAQSIRSQDQQSARVARQLHDSAAQLLAGLILQLGVAAGECDDPPLRRRLESARANAGDALDEIRDLAQAIYPRVLEDLGLCAAVERLVRHLRERHDVHIAVTADSRIGALPFATASVLYRVVLEATDNAVRHSKPGRILITLQLGTTAATAEVTDNGIGFDLRAVGSRDGMGIFCMRERVALAQGRFTISSRPGTGTRVAATVPFEHTEWS